jgi:hypothetical protein
VSKIQDNREQTHDQRGKHNNRWNYLPQEIVDDINDFIQNLPSRESHYLVKSFKNRKYHQI